MKILIIGTYIPRRCGIATFTNDLYKSLVANSEETIHVLAISDGKQMPYPMEVKRVIDQFNPADYLKSAEWINQHYDLCIIQHEFGIFGGESGVYINQLVEALEIPLITNFHTILDHPTQQQEINIVHLAKKSSQITVMSKKSTQILIDVYHLNPDKIVYIPHGVPEFSLSQFQAKEKLGLLNKKILLSFGFLGRGKGYETAIEAVSKIEDTDFLYIILGTTHPNVLKQEGEDYRDELIQHVEALQIQDKVKFINQFAQDDLLKTYLSACDMYVSPYPNANQISSGTLSFAMGAGAAILSTPYWYAVDLLSDGRGILFDFKDANALAKAIKELLANPSLLANYRKKAHDMGQTMTWKSLGLKHLDLSKKVVLDSSIVNSNPSQELLDLSWQKKILKLNLNKSKDITTADPKV